MKTLLEVHLIAIVVISTFATTIVHSMTTVTFMTKEEFLQLQSNHPTSIKYILYNKELNYYEKETTLFDGSPRQ